MPSLRTAFVVCSAVVLLLVLLAGLAWTPAFALLLVVGPLVALGAHDYLQTEHSLRRNFPLVGRGRWLMEAVRPFVRQYFIESETDGAPVPRQFRSVVYQRAKGASDTVPFGTKMDAYRDGYEWIAHSIAAFDVHEGHGLDDPQWASEADAANDADGSLHADGAAGVVSGHGAATAVRPVGANGADGPANGPANGSANGSANGPADERVDEHADARVRVGGAECTRPYDASLLNVSAMSYGSLSSNAILALNGGAKLGGFAHNTGEGGLSRHHLEPGGDLVWQIGTGYFGCRDARGRFDPERFREGATREQVRMIEIKISQGAKPGHGGILPAIKNTPEIARARGVEVGTLVASPPAHSAFRTPIELLEFVRTLRELSGGKPVGFKLCVGRESEFVAVCKAMVETGIRPDFVTVDGGEGGTGAAPLEFTNSVGMPLRDALAFVCDCLSGFDLKTDVRVIATGKIFTAFHMVKNLALGADLCNSARGFMMSLGCVQSLVCNTNHCPTGVATQDHKLMSGLVVGDKVHRVASFHAGTLETLAELVAAAGLRSARELNRTHVYRRTSQHDVQRYDELFPYAEVGSLLQRPYPERFERPMAEADVSTFMPASYVAQHAGGIHTLDVPASA